MRWTDRLWIAGWFLLAAGWAASAAPRIGWTFDEPIYVRCGLDFWRTGSNQELLRLGTMPLPVHVATLPAGVAEWLTGQHWDTDAGIDALKMWVRLPNLAFWLLLLVTSFRVATAIGGPWAGRLAVALLSLEPNFLAHVGLATTDIAATALTVWLFHRFHLSCASTSRWGRIVVPAIVFGLALAAKASTVTFGPIGMFGVGLTHLWRHWREHGRASWLSDVKALVRRIIAVAILGTALVFVYCGSDFQTEPTFIQWAEKLPSGVGRDLAVWASEHLAVFNNAGVAIVRQVKHNMQGHGCYLNGDIHPRAVWYYFPVAMALKFTLPTMAMLALVPVLAWRTRGLPWAVLVFTLLLAFSVNCRVQIGVRFMQVLLAVGLVGFAGLVGAALASPRLSSKAWLFGVSILVGASGWMGVDVARTWPDALRYVNPIGGGVEGYRAVSDSNYDWGQGWPDLLAWRDAHTDAPLTASYFGTDPAVARLGTPLVVMVPGTAPSLEEFQRQRNGGYFAVSTTVLHGAYVRDPGWLAILRDLRSREKLTLAGTFAVYDFRAGPPPATAAAP